MTNFEQFDEAFEAHLETLEDGLLELLEYGDNLPFGGKVVSDKTVNVSDSYDYTDEELKRVIYFEDFDIHVEFSGTNQSYSGTDWDEYKEVKLVTKTVTVYE